MISDRQCDYPTIIIFLNIFQMTLFTCKVTMQAVDVQDNSKCFFFYYVPIIEYNIGYHCIVMSYTLEDTLINLSQYFQFKYSTCLHCLKVLNLDHSPALKWQYLQNAQYLKIFIVHRNCYKTTEVKNCCFFVNILYLKTASFAISGLLKHQNCSIEDLWSI